MPVSTVTKHPPLRLPFFYGWLIVAISGLTLFVVFGIRLSFSVFFIALIEEFGWARGSASLVFSSNMAVFALTSTLAGLALDRWGVRPVFSLGALLLALGLWLSSRVGSLPQLMLSYGVVAGLGITILGLGPQASIISRWFRRRRGAALGIAFAGTGLGTLILTPATQALISRLGWRAGYQLLALLILLQLPLIAMLMRLTPEQVGLAPDGLPPVSSTPARASSSPAPGWTLGSAMRTMPFWLIMLAGFGAIGPLRMLTVHQLAAMVDAGFDRTLGATVIGGSGAVTAVSFILFGALSDRIGRQRAYAIGSLSLVAAIALLAFLRPGSAPNWLLLYAVLLGLGEGTRSGMVTAVTADLFSGPGLGAVSGAVGAAFGLGAAIFPWYAGRLFDLAGAYQVPFAVAAVAVLLSTLALWMAPRLAHRHRDSAA